MEINIMSDNNFPTKKKQFCWEVINRIYIFPMMDNVSFL